MPFLAWCCIQLLMSLAASYGSQKCVALSKEREFSRLSKIGVVQKEPRYEGFVIYPLKLGRICAQELFSMLQSEGKYSIYTYKFSQIQIFQYFSAGKSTLYFDKVSKLFFGKAVVFLKENESSFVSSARRLKSFSKGRESLHTIMSNIFSNKSNVKTFRRLLIIIEYDGP